MLELVVVVAVLAILAAISIPFFQSLIKQAAYVAGKWTLASAKTSCAANKTLPIPAGFVGTQFSSSKPSDVCSGVLTATHVDGCQLSIDLENGVRTSTAGSGWPETYEVCELGIQIAKNSKSLPGPFTSGHKVDSKGLLPNMDGMYKLSITPAYLEPGEIAAVMATGGRHEIHLFVIGVSKETYKLLALGDLQAIYNEHLGNEVIIESPPQRYNETLDFGLEFEGKGWSNRAGLALLINDEIYEDYADNQDITHDNPSDPGRENTHFGEVHPSNLRDPIQALNRLGVNADPRETRLFDSEIKEISEYNGQINSVELIDSMVHRSNTRVAGQLDFANSTDEWLFGHRRSLSDPDFAQKYPDSITYSSADWEIDQP